VCAARAAAAPLARAAVLLFGSSVACLGPLSDVAAADSSLNAMSIVASSPGAPVGAGDLQVPPRERRRREARPVRVSHAELLARHGRFDAYVQEAAAIYQLPVALLRAVIRTESDFDPTVTSVDGAMGLTQLMPFTAKEMGVLHPFDPRQNVLGGARYLRGLANLWKGNLVLTIASYNAGAGAVKRHHGIPPYAETQRYVRRVLRHYEAYRRGKILPRR
jgi:soluble lytic murein transglycosylase-like protein